MIFFTSAIIRSASSSEKDFFVNTSSRIEGLTKTYNCCILASEATIKGCENHTEIRFEFVDEVQVKGKEKTVKVFAVS